MRAAHVARPICLFCRYIDLDMKTRVLLQAHDKLNQPMEPADHNAKDTVNYLLDTLDGEPRDRNLEELYQILADPDMQAVLMAHDDIARKSFAPVQHPLEPEPVNNTAAAMPDDSPVRYIGITRKPGEPLVRTCCERISMLGATQRYYISSVLGSR